MSIRRAAAVDARHLAEVHVRSWQAAHRGMVPDWFLEALNAERRLQVWSDVLAMQDLDVFVAEDAGALVGFAGLAPSRDFDADTDTGEMTSIYVHPAHWSRGFGRALLEVVCDAARVRGFGRVTLWVLESNRRARGFYERFGFLADGAQKNEPRAGGLLLHEVRYCLELEDG
jgi:ribosomal protein S18 acetylase RimI-like enzyme